MAPRLEGLAMSTFALGVCVGIFAGFVLTVFGMYLWSKP